jgi:glutamate racemase
MKIGVFDSGLGGLIILKSIVKKLPSYDYVYLGDTLHMPYGNKTNNQIYQFTKKGVEFLFKQNCQLVILGCNTASAHALRKIQQEFLIKRYKDKRVLGVIIPTVEEATKKSSSKIGILGTKVTINSKVYLKELKKRNKIENVYQQAAPLLAQAIENGDKIKLKIATIINRKGIVEGK